MQDTRRELKAAGLDPLFYLHIWLFVKTRRETPDFIGSKVGRLSVNFAFLILLDTYLRPFHSWKRVKGIRVYCILLLVNSEEGVGQWGSLFALTRPNWDRHSSFFVQNKIIFCQFHDHLDGLSTCGPPVLLDRNSWSCLFASEYRMPRFGA